ncbi:MAG: iduronate 2-sulfatase [Cyclobacteriaceae bacterium]|jgi:iduronate 2-sulfatase
MNRITGFFQFLFLVFLLDCNQVKKVESTHSKTKQPNVLFIAVDDLNTWIGCLGGYSNTKTPNIDRLAATGTLFSNAHCQAPLCGPSRASIMTGLRPSTTGIYGMCADDKVRSQNPATRTIKFLPEYFRDHGYYSMGIGKLFHEHAPEGVFEESGGRIKGFGPYPEKRIVWDGYSASDPDKYGRTSTDWGAFPDADSLMPDHQSADWVIDRLNKKYNKPFFMGLGFIRPHVPLYVPQKWFDMHPLVGIELAPYRSDDLDDIPPVGLKINDLPMMPSTEWAKETGEWPKIIQAYLACVSYVDYELGRVLEALEQSEYADNTVIVLWSDHGYRLGEKGTFAKHALWNPATNAPLIFAGPGVPKGDIINKPVEMLSIYPTLLELCGLPAYDRNEGKSLVTIMRGENLNEESVAISTFGMNNHAIVTQDYRYIRYEDGGEELYDYSKDPHEWTNEAKNVEYEDLKNILQQKLPVKNAKWDEHSTYNFQPYFVEQKKRTDE